MKPQIVTAIPIPFTSEGDVDEGTYQRAIEFIEPHVDGCCQNHRQFLALDDDERLELFASRDLIGGRTIARLGHAAVSRRGDWRVDP